MAAPNDHLEVFGIGTDSVLYHNWQDQKGAWHSWERNFRSAGLVRYITATAAPNDHLEVFSIGTDSVLYHN